MFRLLFNRSFGSLTLAQFLGAFNDNALKQICMLMAVNLVLTEGQGYQIQAAATALFALPFLVFSTTAGQLADRFSKSRIIVVVKLVEIGVMALAAWGIYQRDFQLILLGVFLLSTQSTFFSPAKYGIIPELLDRRNLSRGNGLIQTTTYLAILGGTASAGVLMVYFDGQLWIPGVILTANAVLGTVAGWFIDRQPPADRERSLWRSPLSALGESIGYILRDRLLFYSMVGFSYVWFAGSVLMINLNVYGMKVMGLNETWTSLMIVVLALGLGAGCLLAGRWSGDGIEIGLIPMGAVGMGTSLLVFLAVPHAVWTTGVLLFVAGVFGGLFLIPQQTVLQERPDSERKGSVLGTTNVFSFTAVLVSAAFYVVAVDTIGLSAGEIMVLLGAVTILVGVGLTALIPRAFVRFVLWLLVHTVYSIDVRGRENIPDEGPALIVANHVSYVDGLLIGACFDRFVRFLTFAPLFDVPLIGWFLRKMKMIPVDPRSPGKVKDALSEARKRLREGELVCVFAEGQITRTGHLLGIRRGVEKISEEDVPVIPVHLDEVWGSIFSFEGDVFFWKVPERLPFPLTVSVGEPIHDRVTSTRVREALQSLGAEAAEDRVRTDDPLPTKFIRTARRSFWRQASVDSIGTGPVRFGTLLVMTLAMTRRLDRLLDEDEQRVGVLLPPSVPGAVVNLALACLGKVSVNLNYTTGDDVMANCVRKAEVDRVITARKFLDRIEVEVPVDTTFVRDLRDSVSLMDKVSGFLLSLLPASWTVNLVSDIESNEDVVTVIFSSGSTGEPKGIELTHGSILANVQSLQQVASLDHEDQMMAILPFFHSFGYTGGLWLPVILGIGTCYHYDPMDADTIGDMMDTYEGSIMIGTPTFYRLYARQCDPDQFEHLRLPVCGAEKLKESVAEQFHDTFGVWPLEGYGCTEMSPAISVNLPDVTIDGRLVQRARKQGSVGRPLPGVAVRIVDPDTGEVLEDGEEGLILVRGANRMKGYLNQPDLTEETFRGDWYVTGDVGRVDAEGFLHITDRLARFSKIGGEMVPHVKIEEEIEQIEGIGDVEFAVTGVSDDRKGEQLVVLHDGESLDPREVIDELRDRDLPNLWIPSASNFFEVEEIPKLGTGTLDIQAVKEIARDRTGTK
jgi:acyl-[acyl-carrier-protein]-phospholipid O-acyltransferase/long-chain-fatty-acid--[acyl-carrier-protein] ligase